MRPVNLIPPEERRGEAAPTRTGALSYVIVGALALALLAVTGLVLAGNSVKDKEAEVASLEQRASEAEARAANLASFSKFETLKEARVATITDLATSRFDWERVMNELSRVLPNHIWLVNLTGTASPEVTVSDSASVGLRGTIPGTALELVGCGRSQRDVAALITAVEDIDGVTRVTVGKSEKPDSEVQPATTGKDVSDDCRTRSYVARFELVAAFDDVSPSVGAEEGAAPIVPGAPAPPGAPEEAAGVDEAQQAGSDGGSDVADAQGDAQQAANLVPGGGS